MYSDAIKKTKKSIYFFCSFILFYFPLTLFAEGSKQLMPDIDSRAALCTQGNSGFAGFASAPVDRLFIHIKDAANEVVYLNFSLGYGTGFSNILGEGNGENYYFRIKDPAGNIVFGPQLINTSPIPSGNIGYNQILAGPSTLAVGGYTPYTFTPTAGNGDYYIEFNRTDANNATSNQCSFDYWDITVANSGAEVKGRVWAYSWGFYSKNYANSSGIEVGYSGVFKGKVYSYSNEQIVQSIDFLNSGLKGGSFRIGFSDKGPGTSGNYALDRQSIYNARVVGNTYKVFLNDPDITVYPTGTIVANNLTLNSPLICDATSLSFSYTLLQPGVVELLLDFNGNNTYDPQTRDRVLIQSSPTGTSTLTWDLKDGLGNTVTPATDPTIKLITTYGKSVSHFTLADVEYFSGGFIPEVVRPLPPTSYIPKLYYDDVALRAAIAGSSTPNRQYPDTLLPYNTASQPAALELNGCNTPCHYWTNFGTFSSPDFQDNNIAGYGNNNSLNTWWYSFLEQTTKTISFVSCSVLPLRWLDVSGNLNNSKQTLINWKVQETGVLKYIVERSSDGRVFNQIATINSKGDGINTYTFTDVLSLNNTGFYRVMQIDINSKISYSPVVKLSTQEINKLMLYPNPVKNIVTVTGAKIGNTLFLTDASSKRLQTINITHTSFTLDMNKYSSGIYFLKTNTGLTQKLIKID